MKKRSLLFMITIVIAVLIQAGCSKNEPANLVATDWEQIIRTDFFSGETPMEKAMAESVSFKVKQDGEQIAVTVTAPDICDNLLNWMDAVSDDEFTESAMEQEILRLLKESKKTEVTYTLNCSGEGESAEIAYTSEFGEAMTCGLTRFYAEVTQRILEEMEGNVE